MNLGKYFVIISILFSFWMLPAHALLTIPDTMTYQGTLSTAAGIPIATPHTIRFSIWSTAGVAQDTFLPDGSIDIQAQGFADFVEEHTITPNARGVFYTRIGQYESLPVFEYDTHTYLQVEVKPQSAPASAYEVLDPDGILGNGNDRKPITSVAYASNADRLANHSVGDQEGSIAVLGTLGQWDTKHIPGGTNEDVFAIDADDTATTVGLSFGKSSAAMFSFDAVKEWFSFSHDVDFGGHQARNLVTHKGTVFPTLAEEGQQFYREDESRLYIYDGNQWKRVSEDEEFEVTNSDAITLDADDSAATVGLSFGTTAGAALSYERVRDTFTLSKDLEIQGNMTQTGNELRLGTANTGTGSHVQIIAEQGGEPSGILRYNATTNQWEVSNDGVYFQPMLTNTAMFQKRSVTKKMVLSPEYPNYTLAPDGSNNTGTMTSHFLDLGGIEKYVMYQWKTRNTVPQDMDIVIRFSLPEDFGYFATQPLTVQYRTTSRDINENAVSVQFFDTLGNPVVMDGLSAFADPSVSSGSLSFADYPDFEAGKTVVMRIKLMATKDTFAEVGDITLNYIPAN